MPDLSPPPRRRPAPAPKPAVTIEGLTVIGGPAPIRQYGRGVFTEGQANKQWPFIHGAKLIGVMLDEYTCKGAPVWHGGSDSKHVGTHYWVSDHTTGELRYVGKLTNRDSAAREINRRHLQRVASQATVSQQKVVAYGTPPKRARSTG